MDVYYSTNRYHVVELWGGVWPLNALHGHTSLRVGTEHQSLVPYRLVDRFNPSRLATRSAAKGTADFSAPWWGKKKAGVISDRRWPLK
jgi:hypothetical protein